jgi:outer membrane protein TolC
MHYAMSSFRSRARATLAICALSAFAPLTHAEAGPREIDERTVMTLSVAKNPTLAAAMSELRRAELLEQAEAHRYPFTLLLDAKALRNAVPMLGATGVTFPESTTYSAGAELRKKLSWGTDLSLRVEGTRQSSSTVFSFAVPGMPPVQTLYQLGPGYGGSVRLGLTQPLLRGSGRDVVMAALDAARIGRSTAGATRDRTASQLLLDALTAYWELYYASRALDIQRQSLELARAQRDESAARAKTGSVAPVEVLTFESRVAGLEEDLVAAESEERRRSTALARLLGDETLSSRRAAEREPARHSPPLGDLRRRALEASPEIAEQRSAVTLAETQARSTTDPLRHRLDLDGYVQANGLGNREVPPVFDQLGGLKAITAQVTLTYEAPLDGTRQRAETTRAQLAISAARQRLDATSQRVLADLDDAEQRRVAAEHRIELADRTFAVSQQQFKAENARFRTGSGTALEVRAAEEQVRTSSLRAVRARVDLVVAELTLRHLTGGLLPELSR